MELADDASASSSKHENVRERAEESNDQNKLWQQLHIVVGDVKKSRPNGRCSRMGYEYVLFAVNSSREKITEKIVNYIDAFSR